MPRPKNRPDEGPSRSVHVRLHPQELAGLTALGRALQLPPSRIHRRLIREAINGGPDYFDDGVHELRLTHVHLAAVGRNLNQLVKAVNRGDLVLSEDLYRVIDVLRLQVAGMREQYLHAVSAAAWRAWQPLYQEAGLPSPFDQDEGAAPARPAASEPSA